MIIPLSLGVLTRIIASFGAPAVAAYGVATRIEFFSLAVLSALSAVIGPFVGQNWGAGQFARVKQGVRLSKRFCLLWGLGLCLLLQLGARPIAALFNADAEVVRGVVLYLRIVPWAMGMEGILLVMVNVMSVLEKPFHGALLIFTQMFVLCLPAAYLGSQWWGLGGVFAAVGAAYALGGSVCHLLTPWIIGHGQVGAQVRSGRS